VVHWTPRFAPLSPLVTIPVLSSGSQVSADLVMWSKVDCTFITLEERAIDATLPETFCDFEHWQFYPPRLGVEACCGDNW